MTLEMIDDSEHRSRVESERLALMILMAAMRATTTTTTMKTSMAMVLTKHLEMIGL